MHNFVETLEVQSRRRNSSSFFFLNIGEGTPFGDLAQAKSSPLCSSKACYLNDQVSPERDLKLYFCTV